MTDNPLHGTRLTPKGVAMCDFLFRDAPAAGIAKTEADKVAFDLIEQWDGTETLLQIYQRTVQRPSEIAVEPKPMSERDDNLHNQVQRIRGVLIMLAVLITGVLVGIKIDTWTNRAELRDLQRRIAALEAAK